MTCFMFVFARRPMRLAVAYVFAAALGLQWFPSIAAAHHSGHRLSIRSPKCGWTESDSLRDQTNVSEFCDRWVPGDLRIRTAGAERELLWIEAPSELASTLDADDRSTAALLSEWLKHWREISGYKTATIMLLRNHAEFARIYTTMAGDVVAVR